MPTRIGVVLGCAAVGLLWVSLPARANHIPLAFDVPALWAPLPGAGYLDFVETVPPTFGATEEYTGWVDTPAAVGTTGATPDAIGPAGPAFDNGVTHGDRVDFDVVVENRPVETGVVIPPFGPLHAGNVGFMEWQIAPTQPSAHINPASGLPHAHAAPPIVPFCPDGSSFVCLPDYAGITFDTVDVFSTIADPFDAAGVATDPAGLVSDANEFTLRDAALDYDLFFCNAAVGCVPGVATLVFVPGWTNAASADDFVARWTSPIAATHVIIDPTGPGPHPDEITQIDAIVAARVPGPPTLLLIATGLVGLAGLGGRRPA